MVEPMRTTLKYPSLVKLYKAQSKQQKEAERKEPEVSKPEVKNAPAQTVHQQPKPKSKNVKER